MNDVMFDADYNTIKVATGWTIKRKYWTLADLLEAQRDYEVRKYSEPIAENHPDSLADWYADRELNIVRR